MKNDVGKLEGGYRLVHIQRTKRSLFIAQAIIILAFAIYLLWAEGGFSLSPFFISVNSFIYFVLIMGIVVMVEGFVFITLELRFMKSHSAKFLITQRSARSAMIWAAVSLIAILLLWAPILPEMLDANMGAHGSVSSDSSTVPGVATMFNSDPLGMVEVNRIEMVSDGHLAEVYILTEANYELFKDSGKATLGAYRVNADDFLADPEIDVEFPATRHSRFYILVYSVDDAPVTVSFETSRNVNDSLVSYLSPILAVFLIGNSLWAAYMFMMNKRFKQGIYR
ncbi:MAG: hypothetical protein AB9819_08545 [Methanomassiliicoccales archaeon]